MVQAQLTVGCSESLSVLAGGSWSSLQHSCRFSIRGLLPLLRQSLEGSNFKAGSVSSHLSSYSSLTRVRVLKAQDEWVLPTSNDLLSSYFIFRSQPVSARVHAASHIVSRVYLVESMVDLRFIQRHHSLFSQVNERCPQIIQDAHPHLEKILFTGAEFRIDLRSIKCIDWSPSFTIEELQTNPFQSSLMDVDEGITVNAEEEPSSSSRRLVVAKNAKISSGEQSSLSASLRGPQSSLKRQSRIIS